MAWKVAVDALIQKRTRMEKASAGRDFSQAAAAVERLPEFQDATFVRVGRGLGQSRIRLAALQAGKILLVPRSDLRRPQLLLLDPSKIAPSHHKYAVTEGGMNKLGKPVGRSQRQNEDRGLRH